MTALKTSENLSFVLTARCELMMTLIHHRDVLLIDRPSNAASARRRIDPPKMMGVMGDDGGVYLAQAKVAGSKNTDTFLALA
jgi:hypothetical protein